MNFNFSGSGLTGRDKTVQRFFEILPGATSWIIIAGMAVLAFVNPLAAALIVIAFYFYWLLRLLAMTLFLILSYLRLSLEKKTDWMKRAEGIDRVDEYLKELQKKKISKKKVRKKLSLWFHRRELERLQKSEKRPPLLEDIHHLVIVPVAKETQEIIEPGIKALADGTFPAERILIVFALEERASAEVAAQVKKLKGIYSDQFCEILIVVHPDGMPGEARVKGANATFAAKYMAEYFSQRQVPYENIIVSCFDADTVVGPNYIASLTYYFMIFPERERASFQPVPVYNNNIWDAPGITRVLDVGASFFQLIEATNPEKLVTFSSHSMSFKALVDVGYWPVDMISDDSAIFWKAFIHFDGQYHVVPMNMTLSMDAVVAGNLWQTMVNVYKQKRRWAWGVENFPIVMRAFLKDRKISLYNKVRYSFKLFEGHISWTTWAFLLTIIGWLPAVFAGKDYSHSVVYYSIPRITGTIFNLASFSLITSIVLSLCLLPPARTRFPVFKKIGFAFQWLLVPFTIIFLSALPALDAQTRLMRGRYLTFWVTDKGRKKM